jgi:uncharacterized membrane protein YqaE (UPF0057 family)
MKIKSIISLGSVLLTLLVLISSCGSTLNITKRRHSSGYYVSISGDDHNGSKRTMERKDKARKADQTILNKIDSETISTDAEKSDNAAEDQTEKIKTVKDQNFSSEQITAAEEFSQMSTLKKIKALKRLKKENKSDDNAEVTLLLLVILAILLPPVAVYMKRGVSTPFWLSILLSLLFWLPGIIYALLIVFDEI